MASVSGSNGDGQYPGAEQTQSAPPNVTSFNLDLTTIIDPAPLSAPPLVQSNDTTTSATGNTPITITEADTTNATNTSAAVESANTTQVAAVYPPGRVPASADICNALHGQFASSGEGLPGPVILNGSYPITTPRVASPPAVTPAPTAPQPLTTSHTITFGQMPPTTHVRQVSQLTPQQGPMAPGNANAPNTSTDAGSSPLVPHKAHSGTARQQLLFHHPRIATWPREDQVLPACDIIYYSDIARWSHVWPWNFPYGDVPTETAFVLQEFGAEDVEAWGGTHGDADGIRFLKNVWLHIALFNAHRISLIANQWWSEDDHVTWTNTKEGVEAFDFKDIQLRALFTDKYFEMYSEEVLWHVLHYIVDGVRHFVQVKDREMLEARAKAEDSENQIPTQAAAPASTPTSVLASNPVTNEATITAASAPPSEVAESAREVPAAGFSQPSVEMATATPAGTSADQITSISIASEIPEVCYPQDSFSTGFRPTGIEYASLGPHPVDAHALHHANAQQSGPVDPTYINNTDQGHEITPYQAEVATPQPSALSPAVSGGHRYFAIGSNPQPDAEESLRNENIFHSHPSQRSGDGRGRGYRRNSRGGRHQHHGIRRESRGSLQQQSFSYHDAFQHAYNGGGDSRGGMQQVSHENVAPPVHMPQDIRRSGHATSQSHYHQANTSLVARSPAPSAPQQYSRLYDPGAQQRETSNIIPHDDNVTSSHIGKNCDWATKLVIFNMGAGVTYADMGAIFSQVGARVTSVYSPSEGPKPWYIVEFATHIEAREALAASHHRLFGPEVRVEVAKQLWDPTHPRYQRPYPRRDSAPRVSGDARVAPGYQSNVQYEPRPFYIPQSMIGPQSQIPYDQRNFHQPAEMGFQSPPSMPSGPMGDRSIRASEYHAPAAQTSQAPQTPARPSGQHRRPVSADNTPKSKGTQGGKRGNKKRSSKGAPPSENVPASEEGATQEALPEIEACVEGSDGRSTTSPTVGVPSTSSVPMTEAEPQLKRDKGKQIGTSMHPGLAPSAAGYAISASDRKDSYQPQDSTASHPAQKDVLAEENPSAIMSSETKVNDRAQQPSLVVDTTTQTKQAYVNICALEATEDAKDTEANVTAETAASKVRLSKNRAKRVVKKKAASDVNITQSVTFPSGPSNAPSASTDTGRVSPTSEASEATAKQGSSGSSNGKILVADKRIISGSSVTQTPTEAYHTAPNTPGREEPMEQRSLSIDSEEVLRSKVDPEPEAYISSSPPKDTAAKKAEKAKGPSQTESLSMFANKNTKKAKKAKPVAGASKKGKGQQPSSRNSSAATGSAVLDMPGPLGCTATSSEFDDSSDAKTATASDWGAAKGASDGMSSPLLESLDSNAYQSNRGRDENDEDNNVLTLVGTQPVDTEALSDEETVGSVTPMQEGHPYDTGLVSAGEPHNPVTERDDDEMSEPEEEPAQGATESPKLTKAQRRSKKQKEKKKEKRRIENEQMVAARDMLTTSFDMIRANPDFMLAVKNGEYAIIEAVKPEEVEERPEYTQLVTWYSERGDALEYQREKDILTAPLLRSHDVDTSDASACNTLPPEFTTFHTALHHIAKQNTAPSQFALRVPMNFEKGMYTDFTGYRPIIIDPKISPLAKPDRQWGPELNFRDFDSARTAAGLFVSREEFVLRWGGGHFIYQGLSVQFCPETCETPMYIMPAEVYMAEAGSASSQ